MKHWNLRKVYYSDNRQWEVCEVYYDKKNRPYAFCDADWTDKLRFIKDWLFKPAIVWPDDFNDEQLKKWGKAIKDAKKKISTGNKKE